MSLDLSKIVSALGDEAIAKAGEPVGLDKEQAVRVARALSAKFGLGQDEAVKAAAADTGLNEDVVTALLKKLFEAGKEKLLAEGGVGAALEGAKDQAMAAFGESSGQAAKAAGGLLGGLFGRKK